MVGVVRVLDVQAHRARRLDARRELGVVEPVAGLHVGRHGHRDGAGDARDGREHLLDRRLLAVLVAQRLRDAAAGGGDGGEAGLLDQAGGAGVPCVGEDQGLAGDVQTRAARRRSFAGLVFPGLLVPGDRHPVPRVDRHDDPHRSREALGAELALRVGEHRVGHRVAGEQRERVGQRQRRALGR
jgi:hypothetical protein